MAVGTLAAVALGGAAGALLRHVIAIWIGRPAGLPWAILLVNLSGALALGILATLFAERFELSAAVRIGLTVGLLGGYTTFSTLSVDSLNLIDDGRWGWALANLLVSGAGGLGAAWLGQQLARW